MAAVWMRVRAEMRARWRATLSLALLVAVGAGGASAAFAAARRTDSAHARFIERHRGADFLIRNFPQNGAVQVEKIRAIAGVAVAEPVKFFPLRAGSKFLSGLARSQDPMHASIDRFKIVSGRAADPARAEEVVASLGGAHDGLRVGRTFSLATVEEDPIFADLAVAIARRPLTMRVVGVAAAPGGFPPQVEETATYAYLTPAFFRAYPNAFGGIPDFSLVKVAPGASRAAVRSAIAAQSGDLPLDIVDRTTQDANVERSTHLQAIALWALAALAGAVALLALVQMIGRQIFSESDDSPVLGALGMTRGQRASVSVLRVLAAGGAGLGAACGLATALSSLAPIGIARTAEPNPGAMLDGTVLGVAAAVALAVMIVAAAAASRRVASRRRATGRRSRLVEGLASAGLPAPAVAGLRFALEPGSGRSAVPVRTTITGIAIGVASLAGVLTFGASLDRLLREPALYGVSWDMSIGSESSAAFFPEVGHMIERIPGVAAVGIGNLGLDLLVDGTPVEGLAFEAVTGDLHPPVLEGAPARKAGELLLGTHALQRVGVRIGDEVRVGAEGAGPTIRMRIVGRGVVPAASEATRLGEGALITVTDFLRFGEMLGLEDFGPGNAFIRLSPGVTREQMRPRLIDALAPGSRWDEAIYEHPLATPADVASFGGVRNLPLVLAGLLAALASITLGHMLVTGIRRRRHDLAVLKTLGFVRAQVRRTVGVQASALAAAALAVGLPAGVASGRWAWATFADDLGIVVVPVVPLAAVLLAIPATILVAGVIALVPGRVAANLRPAVVLRAE